MDDDLWGPPLVVQDDTFRNQTLRGCEFWFDCRTDVLEENFQNERYCEQVWRILNEKKHDAEINERERDSVSLHNDMASSGKSGDSHDIVSSDSDKTLSAVLPDGDTSSAKSSLDEDENTSSISDAQTIETRDSSNDPETRLKPQETAANEPLTVEAGEDADTSSGPVLASKNEEAEEHSCSSLVTDQVFDPIKQATENKSSSAISRENIGGSTLKPSLLETREKVREKTNEDGEILKDHQKSNSLQDIVTVSEPFTTESLLEMCDEPEKGRETTPCDERSKKSHPEAKKTVVKEELIMNLLTEASQKAEKNALLNARSHPEAKKTVVKEELIMNLLSEASQKAEKKALLNARSVLIKKRQSKSTSFIRNTKQKVQGEKNVDPVKNATPEIIMGSSVPTRHAGLTMEWIEGRSQKSDQIVDVSLMSTSELKSKTGKQLKSFAKELKLTNYCKLKKEDLLQRILRHLGRI